MPNDICCDDGFASCRLSFQPEEGWRFDFIILPPQITFSFCQPLTGSVLAHILKSPEFFLGICRFLQVFPEKAQLIDFLVPFRSERCVVSIIPLSGVRYANSLPLTSSSITPASVSRKTRKLGSEGQSNLQMSMWFESIAQVFSP